jgi:hypothetical protein
MTMTPDELMMPPRPANPLAGYFRTPGMHVRLPTNGAFMPPGAVAFAMDGQVPVYPMRSADEMLLKNADALMSGFAIEKLIESCVPAIKTPRLISSPDLDVILLAIRAATMGDVMQLSPVCPQCETVNEAHVGLAQVIATMKMIPAECSVRLNDEVVVYIRPHNMEDATRLGLASFEEQRKLQGVEGEDQASQSLQMSRSMARLANLNSDVMAECVIKVVVPTGAVTDRQSIREFMGNISKVWTDKINAKLMELLSLGIDKHFPMQCSECKHQWNADIEFNPATFFDSDSSAS